MSQNSFPRRIKNPEESKSIINDELKKFYVACTRSKNNLYFTRSQKNFYGYSNEKSVFLNYLSS
jgi:superfamily I DNA/RNA helicase